MIRNTKKAAVPINRCLQLCLHLFIPLIAIVYWALDLYSYFGYFDITPALFLLTLILLNIATYKYNFLSILPLAYHRVIDNLNDIIIIIDKNHKIVSINESYYNHFSNAPKLNEGDGIVHFTNILVNKLKSDEQVNMIINAIKNGTVSNERGELYLFEEEKYLTVDISLYNDNNENVGRVIKLSDVTGYRELFRQT